jgi:hypothetical protein
VVFAEGDGRRTETNVCPSVMFFVLFVLAFLFYTLKEDLLFLSQTKNDKDTQVAWT